MNRFWYRVKNYLARKKNKYRSAGEVFSDIYAQNLWGGNKGEFYSGGGSRPKFAVPYVEMVSDFIRQKKINPLRIVDLGCGDFRVGKNLTETLGPGVDYTGVDVVKELIARNTESFSAPNTRFVCLDIINDELPNGNVCLIRQVLQHLSNKEIERVIRKFTKFDYVFVTEHYPSSDENVIPNKDKIHGPDVRVTNNSGVYLDKDPFNIPGVELKLSIPDDDWKGVIRTFLIDYTRPAET